MAKPIPTIRLENTPADFQKRGVTPGPVQVWEDGRRDDDRPGAYEWWYFDFMMDDGVKVVIHFHTKPVRKCKKKGYVPSPGMAVYLPDGTQYEDEPLYTANDISLADDHCDVKMGPHTVSGDLKTYKIHYERGEKGLGADLTPTSLSKPWRPGNAYFDFGNDEYFTWLCVVPKGKVEGIIEYGGQKHHVTGFGYHDHQWCTCDHVTSFNNWFWGRQSLAEHTLLNFYIVTSKRYNYQKIALTVIEDKDGKVIFENTDPTRAKWEVTEEYTQKKTGRKYPKHSVFTVNGEQGLLKYDVDVFQEIGCIDVGQVLPKLMIWVLEKQGFHPTYVREAAHARVEYTPKVGTPLNETSDMIYEFIYPGISYLEHL